MGPGSATRPPSAFGQARDGGPAVPAAAEAAPAPARSRPARIHIYIYIYIYICVACIPCRCREKHQLASSGLRTYHVRRTSRPAFFSTLGSPIPPNLISRPDLSPNFVSHTRVISQPCLPPWLQPLMGRDHSASQPRFIPQPGLPPWSRPLLGRDNVVSHSKNATQPEEILYLLYMLCCCLMFVIE